MLLFEALHFLFCISNTKSNLTILWAIFDILSVSLASQYSSYVLEHLGRFILTNAALSNSLTSTSSSEGLATAYNQANKYNFFFALP